MAKSKDLRVQTAVVATPVAGVVSLYADASGIINSVNENGAIYSVGQLYSGSAANMGFPVTQVLSLGITGTLTGAAIFLPVVGPSGVRYAFPVWRTS